MAYFQKVVKKRLLEGEFPKLFPLNILEKEALKSLDPEVYTVKVSERNDKIDVEVNKGKPAEHYSFTILLSNLYPFKEPEIKLRSLPGQYSLIDFGEIKKMDTFFKKPWTPNINWKQMIISTHEYLKKHVKRDNTAKNNKIFNIFDKSKLMPKNSSFVIVFAIAIILRIICGLGGYSGANDPPLYGDYEAQRHWMELTVNLHTREWYTPTPNNDIKYWRIDYPPLSAYMSYIFGLASKWFEPSSVALHTSRGYETPSHKTFMRWTVLLSDILLLMSAITAFAFQAYKKYNLQVRMIFLLLILTCPLLVLIDHGHFQYNCITLGLTIWGMIFCINEDIWIGSILFVLALNMKQMALYYAIPFFCFILGSIYRLCNLHLQKHNDSRMMRWSQFFAFTLQAAIFVVVTTLVLWWPWISSLTAITNVLKAIFPVKRGLYQLKVGTFWCISDVIFKWQTHFSTETLLLMSVCFTLIASLPSALILIKMPRQKYFMIALFNIAMAFFFFSYHVHEKTILLPLLPFLMSIRYFKVFYLDYILVATFTNYHMLVEDKLTLEYFGLTCAYGLFVCPMIKTLKILFAKPKSEEKDKDFAKDVLSMFESIYEKLVSKIIYSSMIILTIANQFIEPPEKYPFLFQLLFAAVGFAEFVLVFIYSNLKMYYCFKKDYEKEMQALNFDVKEVLGKLA